MLVGYSFVPPSAQTATVPFSDGSLQAFKDAAGEVCPPGTVGVGVATGIVVGVGGLLFGTIVAVGVLIGAGIQQTVPPPHSPFGSTCFPTGHPCTLDGAPSYTVHPALQVAAWQQFCVLPHPGTQLDLDAARYGIGQKLD